MKKYELTEIVHPKISKLRRIRALTSFSNVKAGDLGGWIESEENLSQDGLCWVADNSRVFNGASISGNALVSGNVWICDNASVSGNAHVTGAAKIFGDVLVYGNAQIL